MSRRLKVAALTAAATAVFVPGAYDPADAAVHQLEPADRTLPAGAQTRVTYAERLPGRHGARLYFELNNGATYRATACRHEDSRNCWWDAARRGNGQGRSFVDLDGRVLRVPARLLGGDR